MANPEKLKVGDTFNRLTIIEEVGRDTSRALLYRCRCMCGGITTAKSSNLRSGHTKSCGCLNKEINTSHGGSYSPEYNVWKNLKQRCSLQNHKSFRHYGGRGIFFDPSWATFENFIKDMGPRPSSKHSLDRVDNNKGYCKENCRWTDSETQNNNKSDTHLLSFKGVSKSISQWARDVCIGRSTLSSRVKRGWTIEHALTTLTGSTAKYKKDMEEL